MRFLIYGENTEDTKNLLKKTNFEIVTEDPDMIAVVGGDGTLMAAEKDFPEIPKFILKKSKTSKKGHDLTPEEIIEKIVSGRYKIDEEIKIEAGANGKGLVGLNEIIVHNTDPRRAIRYEIHINGKQVGKEIIGDGIIVSTPYGSTGYYKSITGSFFEVGVGVAFNNSTEQSDHMVLKEDTKIVLKVIRGKAIIYADNNNEEIVLDDGEEVLIKKYSGTAKIVKF